MACRHGKSVRVIGAVVAVAAALSGGGVDRVEAEPIPFDTRWEYPNFLSVRPAEGEQAQVNPPRFSWPYRVSLAAEAAPHRAGIPKQTFRFQISDSSEFDDPVVDQVTPFNFYNALAPLESGTWYWRVRYMGEDRWSEVRSFAVDDDTPVWDRSVISEAYERLVSKPRPRFGPTDGDWRALRQRWEADEQTAAWLEYVFAQADDAVEFDWWAGLPDTDRVDASPLSDREWVDAARRIAMATFAYRLTGDDKYAPAKDRALELAQFEPGGRTSPEYHGPTSKWPTQIVEYLALMYDWWHADLAPAERESLRHAINWRLQLIYHKGRTWGQGEDQVQRRGIAGFARSHPYENLMWSTPAVLLMAGEVDDSQFLVELVLHYLTGVTFNQGPDEAYNDGASYSTYKTGAAIRASTYAIHMLPELDLGRNPAYHGFGQWHMHLLRLGIDRLAFSDYAATPDGLRRGQIMNMRLLAWLTGNGIYAHRTDVLREVLGSNPTTNRPWLALMSAVNRDWPEPEPFNETARAFKEAGWVMVHSDPPSDLEAADDATSMIFISRPRGGWGHSYQSDNNFVWHALGTTLSAGGGTTYYGDPYPRHSLSQNVVLVNGIGQSYDEWQPRYPYVARLLYFDDQDDHVYWVGDATHAYPEEANLQRWHRHIVFLGGRHFVIVDDLAVRDDAEPATFSWLMHVAPQSPLNIDPAAPGFDFTVDGVRGQVRFGTSPGEIAIVDAPGREGYVNRITGEDLHDAMIERMTHYGRDLKGEQYMAHNLWVDSVEPRRQWVLPTILTASREGGEQPQITFEADGQRVRITDEGATHTVSFSPAVEADVRIDLSAMREHARSSDPYSTANP